MVIATRVAACWRLGVPNKWRGRARPQHDGKTLRMVEPGREPPPMTTQRNNEQLFARLFRMMDSPYEGEALSAFRQVRRILQEESTSFGAILDHTQQLRETNTALGQQNQELHRENVKFRQRFERFSLARAAATRVRAFSDRFTPDASVAMAASASGSPSAGSGIPRDVGSLIGIFVLIAVTSVSCQLFASGSPDPPQRASAAEGAWVATLATGASIERAAAAPSPSRPVHKLPADFSVDHPPWCPACRPQSSRSEASSWPTRLPADFSIDRPPWCPACRGQPSHPRADRRRSYDRVF